MNKALFYLLILNISSFNKYNIIRYYLINIYNVYNNEKKKEKGAYSDELRRK